MKLTIYTINSIRHRKDEHFPLFYDEWTIGEQDRLRLRENFTIGQTAGKFILDAVNDKFDSKIALSTLFAVAIAIASSLYSKTLQRGNHNFVSTSFYFSHLSYRTSATKKGWLESF